jgi:AbiV family abortive infection protein
MSKSPLYMKTAKEALRNSSLWLKEANNLLFEKENFGHSCALSIYSIEETVKAFACFLVGIGVVDEKEEMVKEVFENHHAKMEIVEMLALLLFSPLLSKTTTSKLDQNELKELGDDLKMIEPYFENEIHKLVKTREKGIYVDVVEDRIISPNDFSIEEAERFFFIAFNLKRLVQFMVKIYEESDENERQKKIKNAKTFTNQLRENIKKLKLKLDNNKT